jgi:hypothetical protein
VADPAQRPGGATGPAPRDGGRQTTGDTTTLEDYSRRDGGSPAPLANTPALQVVTASTSLALSLTPPPESGDTEEAARAALDGMIFDKLDDGFVEQRGP